DLRPRRRTAGDGRARPRAARRAESLPPPDRHGGQRSPALRGGRGVPPAVLREAGRRCLPSPHERELDARLARWFFCPCAFGGFLLSRAGAPATHPTATRTSRRGRWRRLGVTKSKGRPSILGVSSCPHPIFSRAARRPVSTEVCLAHSKELVMNEDPLPETPSPGDDGSVPESFDDSGPSARRGRLFGLRRSAAVATALGGLVLGSAVGGFLITRATGPATTVAAATTSTTTTSPSPGAHSRGGFGGPNALLGVNLLQDAATTIGISEQTLETDLQSGQTVAQVATSKGTTAQAVINALVGDETTAIDNLASSGKIT